MTESANDRGELRMALVGNLATRGITAPLSVFCGFLYAWLTMGQIGSRQYAAVVLVTTLSQLIPFVDMGVGAAVMSILPRSGAQSRETRDLLFSCQRLLCSSGVTVFLVALILGIMRMWSVLLGSGSDSINPNLWAPFYFLGFGVFVSLQLGYRVLTADGRNQLVSVLVASSSLFTLLLGIIGWIANLSAGWYIVSPVIGSSISAGIGTVLSSRVTGLGYFRLLLGSIHRGGAHRSSIAKTSVPMMIITAGLPAVLFSHRIFISHIGTEAELTTYTLASQVYSPAWGAVSGALVFLWPHFEVLRAKNSTRDSLRKLCGVVAAIALVAAVGCGVLVLLIPITGRIISRSVVEIPLSLAVSFGILLFVQMIWLPIGMFLTKARELYFQAIAVMAMTGSGFLLFPWSIGRLGADGPVLTSALLIVVLQLVPGTCYLLKLRSNEEYLSS